MTKAYVPHASLIMPGQNLNATIHGKVHRGCNIATNDLSSTHSDSLVSSNSVTIWNTLDGITNRFVVNVLNPTDLSVSVRYVLGGDCGIYAKNPMT